MIVKIVNSNELFGSLNPKMKMSAAVGILLSELNEQTIFDEKQVTSIFQNIVGSERRFQELMTFLKRGVIEPTPEAVFNQLGFNGQHLDPHQRKNLQSLIRLFLAGYIRELEAEKSRIENSIENLKSL